MQLATCTSSRDIHIHHCHHIPTPPPTNPTRVVSCTPVTLIPYVSPTSLSWRQITNSDFSDRQVVQRLADAWHNTAACKTLNDRLNTPPPPPLVSRSKPRCLSNLWQLRALVARSLMSNSRDPAAYAFRYRDMVNT